MKRFLIAFVMMLSFYCASAQSDTTIVANYSYCELVGTQVFMSNKVTVTVDFGQETKWFQDKRMTDEKTGKAKVFNSMVDALNYMGGSGWLFVQAYVVTAGQQNIYHWLLRKSVQQ
jgi:hypothetical protein